MLPACHSIANLGLYSINSLKPADHQWGIEWVGRLCCPIFETEAMFLLTTYMQDDSQDDVHPSCINHPASRYTFIFPFHSSSPNFCDSDLFLWTFISIQDKPSFLTPLQLGGCSL
jgi:hypothetical protein